MDEKLPQMVFKPIGVVSNEVKERPLADFNWPSVVSTITINAELAEGLCGLEEHSYIIVIFWLHRPHKPHFTLKVHPCGNESLPMVGVFASRSPHRPNPVGEKTVRLLKRQGNILWVEGLDAMDGTPVLDIKPYSPGYDSPADAGKSQWSHKQHKDC